MHSYSYICTLCRLLCFGTLLLPLCRWESEGEEWDDGPKIAVWTHESGIVSYIYHDKQHSPLAKYIFWSYEIPWDTFSKEFLIFLEFKHKVELPCGRKTWKSPRVLSFQTLWMVMSWLKEVTIGNSEILHQLVDTLSTIYRVLYIPGGFSLDIWTINSIPPSKKKTKNTACPMAKKNRGTCFGLDQQMTS